VGLALALSVDGCGSISVNNNDGGGQTGSSGSSGATGAAGAAGSAGSGAGTAGAGGATGGGGDSGAAGSIGTAGAAGAAGSGSGGSGGSGGMTCGAFTCNLACAYGYVPGANGFPTCACNPSTCMPFECPTEPVYPDPVCPANSSIIPAECTRGTDGACAWHAP